MRGGAPLSLLLEAVDPGTKHNHVSSVCDAFVILLADRHTFVFGLLVFKGGVCDGEAAL